MGGSRISKRAVLFALSLFTLLAVFIVPVSAGVQEEEGEYEIYPTLQSIQYETSSTTVLTDQVDVTCGDAIDNYTKKRIEAALDVLNLEESAAASNDHTKLIVGVYGSAGDPADAYKTQMGVDTGLFGEAKKFNAYSLWISDGKIVILGEDTDAAYMGVTTLKRIFEQLEGKTVRDLSIKDYAEVEYRGFIEGYYGNPWSNEDRIDLMQFGSEIKMNQYVYAPKDDPLHNARWRDLYDEQNPDGDEGINKIKALAQAGNESKCFFIYALHPFMHNAVNLSDATYDSEVQVVKAKFEQVIKKAGVRQIAILEDDAGGETAPHMVRFLNDMHNWLVELKKEPGLSDLKTDLLYCPTCYMSTTDSKLTAISNGVDKEVHIVVTGGKIWGEVSESFATAFYNGLGGASSSTARYPYMWVNWPCNDNTKNSQIMGGHNYILHTGIDGSHYEGIILNPIQESESSKVGIFTAADYCWKVWQEEEEGDQAWEDSFKYINHMTPIESEESNALREAARHMITQSPDQTVPGKQVLFDESLNIKDQITDLTNKMQSGTLEISDVNALKKEFVKINNAAKIYLDPDKNTNKRTVNQLRPFLSCLRDMTQADIYLLDAMKADIENDQSGIWANYADAQMVYEQSKTYGFSYYNAGILYARAGRKYLEPFTETALKYISDKVKQIVDPENIKLEKNLILKIGGSTTAGSVEGTPANAMDGNTSTTYLLKTNQKVGDYVGLSFNIPVKVKNIQFALSMTGHENDYIAEGKMEYTEDGKEWKAFADSMQPESGTEVEMEFSSPVEIRGFRWVCTGFGNPSRDRWIAIRNIGYNVGKTESGDTGEEKYTATLSRTEALGNTSGGNTEANLTDGNDTSYVWYAARQGDSENPNSSLAGDYLQLDLGEAKYVGRVRVLVGAGDGDKWTDYHLEYSVDGEHWTQLDSYSGTASGTDTYEVNLNNAEARYIKLINDKTVAKWVKFSEFSVFSYTELQPEPEGDAMDYTNTIDGEWRVEYGDASSKIFPKENAVLKPGEYIGLKLSRIRAVKDIDFTGSGISGLTLEISSNRTEWRPASQIGAARYIRLMNKSIQTITFSLDSFVVSSDEIKPMDLFATSIGGENNDNDARKLGTTRNWMDGNLSSAAKYCAAPAAGSYVTYDLGQEIDLHAVRVYVLDTALDYPRDAKIQASTDNENWTDILTIGDGTANSQADSEKKPVESEGGNWIHDNVNVAYAYVENNDIPNQKARYLRLYFTAAYSHRWVELNEILINNGEYIPDTLDPTFETDSELQRGYELQNLNDGNLTTAFRPAGDENQNGYFIYNLSDTVEAGQINIIQSGSVISNASVSVRTGGNTWKELGVLDKSFSVFDTSDLEAVYAVKLEWKNVRPVIYEIAVMVGPKLENLAQKIDAANGEVERAETALNAVQSQISAAEAKVASAANAEEKLKAEMELQNLYAKRAEAEAAVAEKKGIVCELEAKDAKIQADKIWMLLKNAVSEEEKAEIMADAAKKEAESEQKAEESTTQKEVSASKKEEQTNYIQAATAKQEELGKLQAGQSGGTPQTTPADDPVKEFKDKTLKYEVLSADKKTVTVAGPVNKSKVKTVKINPTVKYLGVTYTVVEIKANAFKGCKKLTSVTIGSNVTKIGKQAFAQCSKLKTVNMKKASKITSFGSKSFSKINAKAKITVPSKKLSKYKKDLKKAGVPKKATIKK